ncbi:hypothetical protein NC653_018461 [Populus alba x Populus x berolinensis]|uniref:Uncharacterized protein n=1 Tax=Populus alba x Populus x berolinensis TaxID=444605 RepID=A0AAD6VVX4_9ROSI|nr:hypothetical protein NC653_018461 [Populus alba x Populus x berolinensis]
MMLFCIWEKYTVKKCPSDCQTRSQSTEEDRGPRPMERHMYSLELLPVSKTFTLWQRSTPGRLLMPGKFDTSSPSSQPPSLLQKHVLFQNKEFKIASSFIYDYLTRGSSKKGLKGATVRHTVGYGNSVESIKRRWTTENVRKGGMFLIDAV